MNTNNPLVDVLCVGHASYDLTFCVIKHPEADEKIVADNLFECGGGPAANAAVCAARLGFTAAFAGYLGQDLYGDKHLQELHSHRIDTRLLVRGKSPTPISTIIVKPDGKRALINYKGATDALTANAIDCTILQSKVILFDGHEPHLSLPLALRARHSRIPTVLDAGSVHAGTLQLMNQVDYLACSEKFARQYAGNVENALAKLSAYAPYVIITLGDKGLCWQKGSTRGSIPAFAVNAIDSTGAGDAFHGALAVAIATGLDWLEALYFASAAGALCCTKMGARSGLPFKTEHAALLDTIR